MQSDDLSVVSEAQDTSAASKKLSELSIRNKTSVTEMTSLCTSERINAELLLSTLHMDHIWLFTNPITPTPYFHACQIWVNSSEVVNIMMFRFHTVVVVFH